MPCTGQYTVDDIMREGPCSSYTRERVVALWGGEESLSPAEIARLPIAVEDRIWVLGRLLFRLSPPRACRVARLIALDVLDFWDPPDVVAWYLGTGDEQAVDAAWDAADSARAASEATASADAAKATMIAWAAADSTRATMAAADSARATRAAAESAAWASAWDAGASAWDAAWASAWDAVSSGASAMASLYKYVMASVLASARKKYLSWVVKAFDPFTPVGDLS
jgi:hypothetical protein